MFVVGLTGNYGMGKSTVTGIFRELGAVTLGTDDIVDSLIEERTVIEKIRAALGNGIFSNEGKLDKKKVADLIFKDKKLRTALEDILHPLVFKKILEFLTSNKKDLKDRLIIVEIPLLFEKEYTEKFNKTITVYTDEELALKRLATSGISIEEALLRLKAQMPIGEKKRRADFTINNNGSLEDTRAQTEEIYKRLLEYIKTELFAKLLKPQRIQRFK